MLTISQLAGYAGVTVRAVRHYHQVGLLPEPSRDGSGYRTYDAAAVVRLIRIRTLAEAGVPLARVESLLDASAEEFADAMAQIDADLRARVRELQEHRRRIARLADGDSLAVPAEVATYLDRMRAAGISEQMVEGERDGWILLAARWPEKIPEFMVDKNAQLDDPRVVRLYLLLDELIAGDVSDRLLDDTVDLMVEMMEEAAASGELEQQSQDMGDAAFVGLMDSFATDSHPLVERLQQRLADRGWTGWSVMERADS